MNAMWHCWRFLNTTVQLTRWFFAIQKNNAPRWHVSFAKHDIEAAAIHGDLEQRDRDQVLLQFANNSCPVLVASDVAARGLDIPSLEMVVNFELPRDADTYVHRIGRTGRAGESGQAFSIVTPPEAPRMRGD